MNRNVESHFAQVPHTNIQRSRFDRSYSHITTFNVGDVVPIYLDQTVMPGDTVTLDTSMVVRLQTLLKPIFGSVFLDTYFFAIPKRLLWKHWKEFMGENNDSAWIPEVTYSEPQIWFGKTYEGSTLVSDNSVKEGTVADYLGLPIGMQGWVSALPFRAYTLVMDSWFRDENLTDPLVIYDGDSTTNADVEGECHEGGKLFKASKYHDYFTSALPSPMKSSVPVSVPANLTPGIIAQVSPWVDKHGNLWNEVKGNSTSGYDYNVQGHINTSDSLGSYKIGSRSYQLEGSGTGYAFYPLQNAVSATGTALRVDNLYAYVPKEYNLTAGSPLGGLNVNISDLRNAFQIQKLFERDARSGTRYTEVIRSHFNTVSPDFRLQRPEYLGGSRINISIHQVINQSEGDQQFLGNLGAFGMTTDRRSQFTYSATEHCVILGVCVARYDHVYSQGVDRSWLNRSRLDYYWPELACISEQPVYVQEIFGDHVSNNKDDFGIFGYQEAYAYMRYSQDRCSAEMRPDATLSLSSWHLGDDYASRPYLSDEWIREDKTNVDRVLAVTSEVSNQILLDVHFNQWWTRPMPMFGVPGLVDHF